MLWYIYIIETAQPQSHVLYWSNSLPFCCTWQRDWKWIKHSVFVLDTNKISIRSINILYSSSSTFPTSFPFFHIFPHVITHLGNGRKCTLFTIIDTNLALVCSETTKKNTAYTKTTSAMVIIPIIMYIKTSQLFYNIAHKNCSVNSLYFK